MTKSQILKNQIDTDYQFLKEDFNAGMFNSKGGVALAMKELERIFSKFTKIAEQERQEFFNGYWSRGMDTKQFKQAERREDWEDERYDFHPRPENVSEVL